MIDDKTSLDNLHGIVEPPPVPWWPPAPGWYVVIAVVAVALAWLGLRYWMRWRSNAYRRAALHQLNAAKTPVEIAELLRRTALAVAPRAEVAALTGERWVAWLDSLVSEGMPKSVHRILAGSVYDPAAQNADVAHFREYAKTWIERHRRPDTGDQGERVA